MNIFSKLNIFQKERFPLRILLFTTLSSILSSAAVSPSKPTSFEMLIAFAVSLLFLFHIRAIDESRDLEMDSNLHPERPVQRGIIKIKELFSISFIGLAICLAGAIYSGSASLTLTLIIIGFTTLAWKDFFAKSFFSSRPVLYHIVNSPQMIFIQWNIYAIYTHSFVINYLMLIQLLLVYNSIFIIEVIRKIKAPNIDTVDTYSSSMGTNKAIYFSISMVFSGFAIFAILLNELKTANSNNLLLGSLVSLATILIMLFYKKKQTKLAEKIMVTGVVIYYVLINSIIYNSTL